MTNTVTSWNVNVKQSGKVNLIFEEICGNVLKHGEPKGKLTFSLSLNDFMLIMIVTDGGFPFDLTTAGSADVKLPVEKRGPYPGGV